MKKTFSKALSLVIALALVFSTVVCGFTVSAEAIDASVKIPAQNDYKTIHTFDNGEKANNMDIESTMSVAADPDPTRTGYALKVSYRNGSNRNININDIDIVKGRKYRIVLDQYISNPKDADGNYVFGDSTYTPWYAFFIVTATGANKATVNTGKSYYDDAHYGYWFRRNVDFTASVDGVGIEIPVAIMEAYFDNIYIYDITDMESLGYSNVVSDTVPENDVYINTDFTNFATSTIQPMPVEMHIDTTKADQDKFSKYTFVYDSTYGYTISAAINADWANKYYQLSVPYFFEAGKTYEIRMTYKSDAWATQAHNGIQTGITQSATWTKLERTHTATVSEAFKIGSTVKVNFQIASILIREINDSEDYQVYDFDSAELLRTNNTSIGLATVEGKDGAATKAVKWTMGNSNKDAYTTFAEFDIYEGETYKLSFDYIGKAAMAIYGNKFAIDGSFWNTKQNIVAGTISGESRSTTGHRVFDSTEWKHYEATFTCVNDWSGLTFFTYGVSTYEDYTFAAGDTLYFDNIEIVKETCKITASAAENGAAKVVGGGFVGSTATFSAYPNATYEFAAWVDAKGNVVSDEQNYTVEVTGEDIALTATFALADGAKTVYDFEDGKLPYGFSGDNSSVAASPTDANGKAFYFKGAGGFVEVYFKGTNLKAGHTYAISYDMYAVGADANMNYHVCELRKADGTSYGRFDILYEDKTDVYHDKWQSRGRIVTAQADGDYFMFILRDKTYIDNIIVTDITAPVVNYAEDFSNPDSNTIITNSVYNTLTYEYDEELGKNVAHIKWDALTSNRFNIPVKFNEGDTYRIQITYKCGMDEDDAIPDYACLAYNGGDLNTDGKGGFDVSTEWTTKSWYITQSSGDGGYLNIGTAYESVKDEEGKVTYVSDEREIFISEIKIDIAPEDLGDMNGDGALDATDLIGLRKTIVNIYDKNVFEVSGDMDGDGDVTIIDLVILKKLIDCPETVVVDEAESLSAAAYKTSYIAVDSNEDLEDASRFRKSAAGKVAYIVYRVTGGITEAVIQYDYPSSYHGDEFEFMFSNNNTIWTTVAPTSVTAKELDVSGWTRYTAYFDNIGCKNYCKIVFPTIDGEVISSLPGIRRLQFNGVTEEVLADMYGYNPSLREAKTVYVDSVNGNDENDGLTPETAKATLSQKLFDAMVPGDTVLLASGGTYTTTGIEVYASGTEDMPITLGAYGTGAKPIITGFDYNTAIEFFGGYVEVSGIKFTDAEGISAVDFCAALPGAAKCFSVTNCEFDEINTVQDSDAYAQYSSGGVHFFAEGNEPSWFDGITVEGNSFNRMARTAVYITTEWAGRYTAQDYGYRNFALDGSPVYLSENVLIRNNSITNNGGDAILVMGTDGALIEYNTVRDSGIIKTRGQGQKRMAWASIWCHSSDNCVIQYNEVSGNSDANRGSDLQAFDIDLSCNDCIVQYNYSHDNAGGFMLLCGGEDGLNGEVNNAIVRYNVSVNDAKYWTYYDDSNSDGVEEEWHNKLAVFDITGSVLNAQIYNNTIYTSKSNTSLITLANYSNCTTLSTTTFKNNIFMVADGAEGVIYKMPTNLFETATFVNNAFYGISAPDAVDGQVSLTGTITENPSFANAGAEPFDLASVGAAYKANASYILTGGVAIENNGGLDYIGNAIAADSKLIGAIR